MGYLRIHCRRCRRRWHVYARDNWQDEAARHCPHCGAGIERQTWESQILPAFGAMADANRELVKDHAGYSGPLFAVDFIADRL